MSNTPQEMVTTKEERLDLLAFDHYGDTAMVEAILLHNPGLAAYGPILPAGVRLVWPEQQPRKASTSEQVTLWEVPFE